MAREEHIAASAEGCGSELPVATRREGTEDQPGEDDGEGVRVVRNGVFGVERRTQSEDGVKGCYDARGVVLGETAAGHGDVYGGEFS